MNDEKVKAAIDDFHDETGLFFLAENFSGESREELMMMRLSRKRLEDAIDDLVARNRTTECVVAAKVDCETMARTNSPESTPTLNGVKPQPSPADR
jgi:hypothetical protein